MNGSGGGFHLHPMYIVYAIAALLALAWDWRVLIGLAVLMAAGWLFAYIDDKRHQTAETEHDYVVSEQSVDGISPENAPPELCQQCNTPLFTVQQEVTTAEEITSFAKTAAGWRDNPEAVAGWMPPGLYCVNGCYAIHSTPIPDFDSTGPTAQPERIPRPVQITLADVLRDGGSYQMHYTSDRGEPIKVLLKVIREETASVMRRVGYHPPRLSRLDPKKYEEIDSWEIEWDEAEQLAGLLRPLLVSTGNIKVGSAARAREMILHLNRRGKV